MKSDLDALMQARSLDALLIFGDAEHNPPMYYFVGGGHVSGALLIKKAGKEPVLFYNDMERDEAAKSGLKIVSFSEFPVSDFEQEANGNRKLANALRYKKILSEYGLSGGRVAVFGKVEFSHLFGIMMGLMSVMPEVEFIGEPGGDSTLLRAMETKDDVEVARIRQMGAVTTTVVKMVHDYLTSCEVREDEVLLKEDKSPLTIGDVKGKI